MSVLLILDFGKIKGLLHFESLGLRFWQSREGGRGSDNKISFSRSGKQWEMFSFCMEGLDCIARLSGKDWGLYKR